MAPDGRVYGAFDYHPLPRRTADRLYMASQPIPQAFGVAQSALELTTREAR
jgi:pilus assembly protein CpaF